MEQITNERQSGWLAGWVDAAIDSHEKSDSALAAVVVAHTRPIEKGRVERGGHKDPNGFVAVARERFGVGGRRRGAAAVDDTVPATVRHCRRPLLRFSVVAQAMDSKRNWEEMALGTSVFLRQQLMTIMMRREREMAEKENDADRRRRRRRQEGAGGAEQYHTAVQHSRGNHQQSGCDSLWMGRRNGGGTNHGMIECDCGQFSRMPNGGTK